MRPDLVMDLINQAPTYCRGRIYATRFSDGLDKSSPYIFVGVAFMRPDLVTDLINQAPTLAVFEKG